jgi:hypothetical protein
MTKTNRPDVEIDKIVDDLVKDEETAVALKGKLRQTFVETETIYIRPEASKDDDDDLWDNIPV